MRNKKIVFGIILFLLIGLTIFTFANPSENEQILENAPGQVQEGTGAGSSKEKKQEESEQKEEEVSREIPLNTGNTIPNGGTSNQGNGNANTNVPSRPAAPTVPTRPTTPTNTDDSAYKDALAAVEKAESTKNQADVDAARKLVNNLTDNKTELSNRLDAVQNYIDAQKAIEKMENDLKNALNQDNITEIITFRTDSKVADLINQISDETVKTEFTNRLNAVSKVIDDHNAPVIEGITDGTVTLADVLLTVKDDNSVKATLNGKEFNIANAINAEGEYEVVITDAAFNETKITFTIDKTAPVITFDKEGKVVEEKTYFNETIKVTIEDKTTDKIALIKDGKEITFTDTLSEDGNYILTVTDKAGNKTEVKFVIDTTAPVLNKVQIFNKNNFSSGYIKNGETFRVIASFNEEINGTPVLNFNNEKYEFKAIDDGKGNTIYQGEVTISADEATLAEGEIKFTVSDYQDKAGNVGEEVNETKANKVLVYDRTAPVLNKVQIFNKNNFSSGYIKNGETFRVIASFNEEINGTPVLNFNNEKYELKLIDDGKGNPIYQGEVTISTDEATLAEGEIKFTVSDYQDKAGNVGEEVNETKANKVLVYDRTAPIASLAMRTTEPTNKNLIVTLKASEPIGDIAGWTRVDEVKFQKKFTRNTTEAVTFYDMAGNEGSVLVEITNIDKEAPIVEVIKSNNDKATNQDVTVTLKTDKEIKLPEGWTKVNATEYTKVYSENGKYSLVVTDLAGNTTDVVFEVKRIDKVAPEATVTTSNNGNATKEDVIVTIVANEAIYRPEGWTEDKSNKEHTFTKTYSENGKYSVVITDKAGNQTEVKFEVKRIDKVAPEATVTTSNNGNATKEDVIVTIVSNEAIYRPEGWTEDKSNKEHTFTKTYSENGDYSVVITDKAGNQTEVKFTVTGIDKVVPEVEVSFLHGTLTNQNEVVTLKFSEQVTFDEIATWLDKGNNVYQKVFPSNTTRNIVFKDNAGNLNEISLNINWIDKVAPAVKEITKELEPDKNRLKVTITTTEDITGISGWYKEAPNKYHMYFYRTKDVNLSFTDLAGNVGTYALSIDMTAPTVEVSYLHGSLTNQNEMVTLKFSEQVTFDGIESWLDKGNNVYQKVFPSNVTRNIVFKDLTENSNEITLNIDWIDKTIPAIKDITKVLETDKNRLKVTVTTTEDITGISGWYKETSNKYHMYFYRTREANLSFADLAGNVGTYTFVADMTAPTITGVTNNGVYKNVSVMPIINDITSFKATLNGKPYESGTPIKDANDYVLVAIDEVGNTTTVNFKIENLALTASGVGSNLIDESKGTINNFNAFAIKFNQDLMFDLSANNAFTIALEYSTDGVNYTQNGTVVNNFWDGTLEIDGNKYVTGNVIPAGSTIRWNAMYIKDRYSEIYNAILATKENTDKVYVRTVFTVKQAGYEETKKFTLTPVIYSQGGNVVSHRGLPTI